MSEIIDIGVLGLALGYLLLLIPLGLMVWLKVPLLGQLGVGALRMTAQLVFVGLYLHVIFELNHWALTLLWILVMLGVADLSVLRSVGLRVQRLWWPLAIALVLGTAVPLLYFVGVILQVPNLLEAQYAIPIAGMILGNCLRADIVGISSFYEALRTHERAYLLTLSQGATQQEALRPFLREAFQAALSPTLASMATIGLVSLPGMMTGILMAGASPMAAIKYQIAIMIAILTGTAITVVLGLLLSARVAFHPSGVLDKSVFRSA